MHVSIIRLLFLPYITLRRTNCFNGKATAILNVQVLATAGAIDSIQEEMSNLYNIEYDAFSAALTYFGTLMDELNMEVAEYGIQFLLHFNEQTQPVGDPDAFLCNEACPAFSKGAIVFETMRRAYGENMSNTVLLFKCKHRKQYEPNFHLFNNGPCTNLISFSYNDDGTLRHEIKNQLMNAITKVDFENANTSSQFLANICQVATECVSEEPSNIGMIVPGSQMAKNADYLSPDTYTHEGLFDRNTAKMLGLTPRNNDTSDDFNVYEIAGNLPPGRKTCISCKLNYRNARPYINNRLQRVGDSPYHNSYNDYEPLSMVPEQFNPINDPLRPKKSADSPNYAPAFAREPTQVDSALHNKIHDLMRILPGQGNTSSQLLEPVIKTELLNHPEIMQNEPESEQPEDGASKIIKDILTRNSPEYEYILSNLPSPNYKREPISQIDRVPIIPITSKNKLPIILEDHLRDLNEASKRTQKQPPYLPILQGPKINDPNTLNSTTDKRKPSFQMPGQMQKSGSFYGTDPKNVSVNTQPKHYERILDNTAVPGLSEGIQERPNGDIIIDGIKMPPSIAQAIRESRPESIPISVLNKLPKQIERMQRGYTSNAGRKDLTQKTPEGMFDEDGSVVTPSGEIIKPNGDVITKEGDIIKPNNDFIASDGTIVKPDGIVVTPEGDVVTPNGDVHKLTGETVKQNGDRIMPSGDIIAPNGDSIRPGHRKQYQTPNSPTSKNYTKEGDRLTEQGEIVKSNGDVYKPSGHIIRKNGDVVAPNGDVTNNKGEIIKPSGEVIDTNGNITKPNGDIITTAGEILRPNGEVIEQNGQIITPRGETIKPNGDIIDSNGNVTNSDGETITPRGEVILPNGDLFLEDGRVEKPNGEIELPNGDTIAPNGDVIKPSDQVLQPNGDVIMPNGDKITASGDVEKPSGEILKPNGDLIAPNGDVLGRDGSVQKPNGDIITPNDELITPKGVVIPPNAPEEKNNAPKNKVTPVNKAMLPNTLKNENNTTEDENGLPENENDTSGFENSNLEDENNAQPSYGNNNPILPENSKSFEPETPTNPPKPKKKKSFFDKLKSAGKSIGKKIAKKLGVRNKSKKNGSVNEKKPHSVNFDVDLSKPKKSLKKDLHKQVEDYVNDLK